MQECTTAPVRKETPPEHGPGTKTDAPAAVLLSDLEHHAKKAAALLRSFAPLGLPSGAPAHLVQIDHVRHLIEKAMGVFLSPAPDTEVNDWLDELNLSLCEIPAMLQVLAHHSALGQTDVLAEAERCVNALREELNGWPIDACERVLDHLKPTHEAVRSMVTRESDFSIPPGLAADCLYDIAAETESILSVLMAALAKHANPDSCELVAATALIRRLDQLNALVMSCASGAPDATFADAYKVLAPSLDNEVRALPPGPLSQRIWDYYGQGAAA